MIPFAITIILGTLLTYAAAWWQHRARVHDEIILSTTLAGHWASFWGAVVVQGLAWLWGWL